VLVYVVLGGMDSIRGSIVATVVLYILPEVILRPMRDYRMLLYAVVMIAVMLFTNSEGAKQFREKVSAVLKAKKQGKSDKGGDAQ